MNMTPEYVHLIVAFLGGLALGLVPYFIARSFIRRTGAEMKRLMAEGAAVTDELIARRRRD